jgi:hypothetical protein
MDRLERSLREALRELPPPEVDTEGVLSRVHAGAGRRRRSRMAFGARVAGLAVVTGVAWAVQPTDLAHGGTRAAGPSTSLPASGGTTAATTAPTPAVAVLSVTASSPDTFWVLGSTGCPRDRLRHHPTHGHRRKDLHTIGCARWGHGDPLGYHRFHQQPAVRP